MGASNFSRLKLATAYYTIGLSDYVKGIECPNCNETIRDFEVPENTEGFTCPYCESEVLDTELKDVFYYPRDYEIESSLEDLTELLKENGATGVSLKDWDKVGTFTSANKEYLGVDKIEVEKAMEETKLPYINSKQKKVKGKQVLEVWLGTDFRL